MSQSPPTGPPRGTGDEQRWRDPHPTPADVGAASDPGSPDSPAAPRGATAAGEPQRGAVRRGAGATAHGARAAARGTARFSGFTLRQARRAAEAEGAGASGLSRLIELHAFNAAGDAAVAISLAGSLFFQVPTGQARGQVALFLGLTMLPFAVVAPLIGPFLDRFSHGRRWAIGATMAIRAFLVWALAGAVVSGSTLIFPLALGVLVASKAYGVARSAGVPRVVPRSLTLVRANARLSLAGVVGATVSAPIAGLAAHVGPQWSLRYAFLVYVLGTIASILLPARIDSAAGEDPMSLTGEAASMPAAAAGRDGPGAPPSTASRRRSRWHGMPLTVAFALRANCGPRWLSGFLTMFMAFLLRQDPVGGWSSGFLIGLVIGAAGLGNTLGIGLGSLMKRINPAVTVVVALAAGIAVSAVAAVFYGVLTLGLLGLVAGLSQALAKLSLDSTIQADVPEQVRTSAFARSDTVLQMAWVIGGFVGIALPLEPRLGLGVAAVVLTAWLVVVLAGRRAGRSTPTPRAASA